MVFSSSFSRVVCWVADGVFLSPCFCLSARGVWYGFTSSQINRRIEEKKVELEDAKKVKAFYVECEKLKEDIVQIPSCSKLNKNIEETRRETQVIRENIGKMDELNERRRCLLNTLLNSVGDLERSTEDPEKYDGIRLDPELLGAIREEARETLKEMV